MLKLDFLNNVVLEEVVVVKGGATKAKLDRQPANGADIRLFATGAIYPSQALIKEMNLEYLAKGIEVDEAGKKPMAFDFIDSRDWGMYPKNAEQHLVFLAAVPKSSPKVDVFGGCKYDDEGNPTGSVGAQGSPTYGKQLLLVLDAVYGVDTPVVVEGQGETGTCKKVALVEGKYIDLKIVRDQVIDHPSNRYHFPKSISRGAKAGQITSVVRENCVINPIVIFTPTEEEIAPVVAEQGQVVESVVAPVVAEVAPVVIDSEEPKAIGDFHQEAVVAPIAETEEVVAPIVEEAVVSPAL